MDWWSELSTLNQALYVIAIFCSVLLVLQFGVSLLGSFGDHDADHDAGEDLDHDVGEDLDHDVGEDLDHDVVHDHDVGGHDHDVGGHDHDADIGAAEAGGGLAGALELFWSRLLSPRSVFVFATMFSWAGALYLQEGSSVPGALGLAALWGVGGSALVALVMFVILSMQETPASDVAGAIGRQGRVHINIPADGVGEVRVPLSGRMQYLKARAADGRAITAGSEVFVVGKAQDSVVSVMPASKVLGLGDRSDQGEGIES